MTKLLYACVFAAPVKEYLNAAAQSLNSLPIVTCCKCRQRKCGQFDTIACMAICMHHWHGSKNLQRLESNTMSTNWEEYLLTKVAAALAETTAALLGLKAAKTGSDVAFATTLAYAKRKLGKQYGMKSLSERKVLNVRWLILATRNRTLEEYFE